MQNSSFHNSSKSVSSSNSEYDENDNEINNGDYFYEGEQLAVLYKII